MRLSALCLKDFPLNIGGKSIGLACTDKKLSFLIIMASMIPLSTLNVFPCFKLLITAWEVYIIIHVYMVYIIKIGLQLNLQVLLCIGTQSFLS